MPHSVHDEEMQEEKTQSANAPEDAIEEGEFTLGSEQEDVDGMVIKYHSLRDVVLINSGFSRCGGR